MDTALGWFGDIFRFLIKLFPHLVIVKTTDEALKWVNGSEEVILTSQNGCRKFFPRFHLSRPFITRPRTGLHWYLPVVTEITIIPVRRQTLSLDDQYLTTKDSKSVGVGGILVWQVRSTQIALTSCEDYEDAMKDISLAAVKNVITSEPFQWFVDNPHDADKLLTKAIRLELNQFGIKTIRCTLSDFCLIRPLGLWGGGSL